MQITVFIGFISCIIRSLLTTLTSSNIPSYSSYFNLRFILTTTPPLSYFLVTIALDPYPPTPTPTSQTIIPRMFKRKPQQQTTDAPSVLPPTVSHPSSSQQSPAQTLPPAPLLSPLPPPSLSLPAPLSSIPSVFTFPPPPPIPTAATPDLDIFSYFNLYPLLIEADLYNAHSMTTEHYLSRALLNDCPGAQIEPEVDYLAEFELVNTGVIHDEKHLLLRKIDGQEVVARPPEREIIPDTVFMPVSNDHTLATL